MRKNFAEVSRTQRSKENKVYAQLLTQYPEKERNLLLAPEHATQVVLETECILYTFETLFPLMPMTYENLFSTMLNMDELLDPISSPSLLQTLRILFESRKKNSHFRSRIRFYDQVINEFKMYDRATENDEFTRKLPENLSPSITQRLSHITEILNPKNARRKMTTSKYAGENSSSFYFYHQLNDNNKKEMAKVTPNGQFPLILTDRTIKQPTPSDRNQDNFFIPFNHAQYATLAKEIDKKLNTTYYSTQWSKLTFQSHNHSMKSLQFDEPNVIYGMLGKGKSTFVILETLRLARDQKKRVAIITSKTTESRDLANTFNSLGIKAVAIRGRGNEGEHEAQHLSDLSNTADYTDQDMFALAKDDHVLPQYRGDCIIEIVNDRDHKGDHPCTSIRSFDEQGSLLLCPLSSSCGQFTVEKELHDAEVVLLTIPAFMSVKLSIHTDPENKSFAEWIYSWADVVFFDEVDALQNQLDKQFLLNESILFNEFGRFEQITQEFNRSIRQSEGHYPVVVYQMKKELDQASEYQMWLRDLLISSDILRSHYKRYSTFSLSQELKNLMYRLWPSLDHQEEEKWFRILYYISEDENDDNLESEVILKTISSVRELKSRSTYSIEPDKSFREESKIFKQLIDQISESMGTKLWTPKNKKEEERYLGVFHRFMAYIYLALFQKHFLTAENLEPAIVDSLHGIYNDTADNRQASGSKLLLPFLAPPLTGRERFYKYQIDDNGHKMGKVGSFFRIIHQASGRDVLVNYNRLFQHVGELGPAVIMLSGTSYAPGSAYYHLNMEYAKYWTMHLHNSEHQTIQHFSHCITDQYGKYISISGAPEDYKEERLEQLSRSIVPLIHQELFHWENDASSNNEFYPRGVVISVNSYLQAKTVYNILRPYFHEEIKYLSKKGNEDGSVTTATMTRLAGNARIFIAPWTVMNRGYNIIRPQTNDALFGSIMLMIRPFQSVNDTEYALIAVNALRARIKREITDGNISKFGDGYKAIRKKANTIFRDILMAENGWANLDPDLKKEIAWYTFINIWQMIGRLLRGEANARIHYMDARFLFNTEEDEINGKVSSSCLLAEWLKLFPNDSISDTLYGTFFSDFHKSLVPQPTNALIL
ncbi:hypothetical protein [Paenibacillus sp. Root444D2]|uniref:hypothetical protein n=1 Tax=Paenibacillus sp. Root444D2 TaxID=1736538 RepID=UPI00070AF2A1|nr:hypothetical protein [Paenibacillus sp. Root444D2]KQX68472.1 hypothetical protein ASD40_23575 [Paenibacillus sp. Root444D2]